MQRRKVCVVVTARPSYSRIKTALAAIQQHPRLELQLVVAASALLDRYGEAVKLMESDGFQPAARVFNVVESTNLLAAPKTTALGIIELSSVFDLLKPHIVVTIADRFETMSTAIAASYMNIPLAHVQGGEVTGNIDEKVRHAITKLADYHFVASESARRRVIALGEEPEFTFNTGCPSIDLARAVLEESRVRPSFDPYLKYGGVGDMPDLSQGYIVVLQHPVTTEVELALQQAEATLQAVHEAGLPALWFWPNVDAGADATSRAIRRFRETVRPHNMHFFKNMEPEDFLRLLIGAKCLVGNSSVGIRECSYLGVPVVNIGSRQHGRDRGRNVIDTPHDQKAIGESIRKSLATERPKSNLVYGGGDAGCRIADLLAEVPLRFHKTITY
jgi:UDP-hydrolysing UDP-N-acetyl-D-glucosamine 2-epimerase